MHWVPTCAVIVTTTWFLPWYLIWFLPLAALAAKPYQRYTGLALTALAIGLQLPLIFGKSADTADLSGRI